MLKFHKIVIEAGGDKPCEHDRVVVHLDVQVNGEVKSAGQTLTFDLGHAEDFGIVKFVDHVVETMGLGEQCIVSVPCSLALTDADRKRWDLESISPHDELALKFRLHDIQKIKKFWQMSESEKVLMTGVMKRRGNKLVKTKQYVRAFHTYKLGIRFLRGSVTVQTDANGGRKDECAAFESDGARQLLVLCYSNAALCLLHLVSLLTASSSTPGTLDDTARHMVLLCIKYCTLATELDPNYAKSWFRLAKAQALLGEYNTAIQSAERSLHCLKTHSPGTDGCEPLIREVESSLSDWRSALIDATRQERSAVRRAVLRRYRDASTWSDDEDDDEDAIERLPISVWSNHLAANMMSLHEELEAFGEKMPEPNMSRSGRGANRINSRLSTIQDEDSEVDEMF
ncbi:hypothetical protein D915_000298 [Fasciola hepatica]|uniref:peptidylprolyl isomerase n=1 Tax=Fasciola hepatica TaxID=6192 RepID=A0A4E0RKG6_FASHE|nr:hypothetical protein D915_000298 [Fasciola hepatica]